MPVSCLEGSVGYGKVYQDRCWFLLLRCSTHFRHAQSFTARSSYGWAYGPSWMPPSCGTP